MVELQGLKPWTSAMPWQRSNQLSYSPIGLPSYSNRYSCKNKWLDSLTQVRNDARFSSFRRRPESNLYKIRFLLKNAFFAGKKDNGNVNYNRQQ